MEFFYVLLIAVSSMSTRALLVRRAVRNHTSADCAYGILNASSAFHFYSYLHEFIIQLFDDYLLKFACLFLLLMLYFKLSNFFCPSDCEILLTCFSVFQYSGLTICYFECFS